MALRRYFNHKAFHHPIREDRFDDSWKQFLADFKIWLGTAHCENEGDPRCLPFHLFKSKVPNVDLDTTAGRGEFAKVHGSQSNRVDDAKLHWKRPAPGQFHGGDTLQIAGLPLAKGYHWDVSSPNTKILIETSSHIWRIDRGGYVNIYPDAFIRKGRGVSKVKR